MNVFLPANVHKRDLHEIHMMAWKRGLKSLYYCRSLSIQRADTVSDMPKGASSMELSAANDMAPLPLVAHAAAGGCDQLRGMPGVPVDATRWNRGRGIAVCSPASNRNRRAGKL